MKTLPEDWSKLTLLDHLKRPATYGVVKAGAFVSSGIPMLRGGDIKAGRISLDLRQITPQKDQEYTRTRLEAKDVVVALVGYPGESAVVPKQLTGANISRAVGLLRLSGRLRPDYLVHFLNSAIGRAEFLRPAAGSAQMVVNLKDLNKLEVPSPPTETEQEAIAEALSDADALIEDLERLIDKKRLIKQSAMQDFLTGKRRLPGFSGEWPLSDFGSTIRRVLPQSSRPASAAMQMGDYPFYLSAEREARIATADHDCSGVIVFSRGGLFRTRHASGPFSMSSDCLGVETHGDSRFFAFWMEMNAKKLDTETFYGSGLRHLDKKLLQDVVVPCPPPSEQSAIADILNDMDAEIQALETRLEKSRQIKEGMMENLLTGRIRLV